MARQIGKLETQQALGGILRDAAREAAGTNTLISQGEQKTLPAFLQRMAEGVRSDKGAGARVSVNDVVDRGMGEAMAAWARHNGASARDQATLSEGEVRAIAAADPALGELTTKAYLAVKAQRGGGEAPAAFAIEALPANDPARRAAERQGSQWNDEDINMGGGVDVATGKLALAGGGVPTAAALPAIAQELFARALEANDETALLPGVPVQTSSPAIRDAVAATGRRVSEDGFDYAPENRADRARNAREVARVVEALGNADGLVAVHLSGTADSPVRGEPGEAVFHLYMDAASGRMASFYIFA